MSLLIALVVFVVLFGIIIWGLVHLVDTSPEPPTIGDGIWRVTTVDDNFSVAIYVSRGDFRHAIGAVHKSALDFTEQLTELHSAAEIKAAQWNEAQADVKTITQETK